MSNNTLRVLTALVGAPVVIGLAYWGAWPFGLLLVLGGIVLQDEVYVMVKRAGTAPFRFFGLGLGTLLMGSLLLPALWPLLVVGGLLLFGQLPFRTRKNPLLAAGGTLLGLVYPVSFLAFLLALRAARGAGVEGEEAFWLTLLVLLLVWATDVFAYYVGRAVGRRKLAPQVSPNKTWEGALGGLAAALLVAAGFQLLHPELMEWGHILTLGFLCSILGQVGDLTASTLKRAAGLKDSGSLLPGHGGLLDRFDGVLFAAPTAYLYLAFVARLFE